MQAMQSGLIYATGRSDTCPLFELASCQHMRHNSFPPLHLLFGSLLLSYMLAPDPLTRAFVVRKVVVGQTKMSSKFKTIDGACECGYTDYEAGMKVFIFIF